MGCYIVCSFFFFFNDTATTEIYTLSLHDALPISSGGAAACRHRRGRCRARSGRRSEEHTSELQSRGDISYAVFCFKKKKKNKHNSVLDIIHEHLRSTVEHARF